MGVGANSFITFVLDCVAAKELADTWAATPEVEREIALGLVTVNETINFALAGLFNLSFAPSRYSGWPWSRAAPSRDGGDGWALLPASARSEPACSKVSLGKPTIASLILTIIGPTIIVLWLLVMGALFGRLAAEQRP